MSESGTIPQTISSSAIADKPKKNRNQSRSSNHIHQNNSNRFNGGTSSMIEDVFQTVTEMKESAKLIFVLQNQYLVSINDLLPTT